MEGFLEKPAVPPAEIVAESDPARELAGLPATIGRYRVVRKIGAGGMGEVYEAEQDHPRRLVALKTIRPGLASDEIRRRFLTEVEVLGQLHHTGIAQVYEAGVVETPSGPLHFFAMERVDGVPLTEHADSCRLDTRERLDLLARLCDAVDYAHQRGVIHRDLKPANILVEASGQPKILDFGVARVTDADIQTTTLHTSAGQLIGTLAYMSPEQAAGDPRDIDPRSDVYALGVIGYELLSGELPLDVSGKSIAEVVRRILEEDPRRLSSIRRVLSGDVETIVSKALEKEKRRRYASASDLGSDIRRYLAGEPIQARPQTALYQLRRLAGRHKGLVAGLAATFLTLVAGIVVAVSLAVEEAAQRKIADEQREAARADSYRANIVAAYAAFEDLRVNTASGHLERAPEEYRGWEWRHAHSRLDESILVLPQGSPARGVVFLADGNHLATGTDDGRVRIWDLGSEVDPRELKTGNTSNKRMITALHHSMAGQWLAAGTQEGTLHVWSTATWELKWQSKDHDHGPWIRQVASSHDGSLLACLDQPRVLHLWEIESGRRLLSRMKTREGFSLAFSPDDATIAVGTGSSKAGESRGTVRRYATRSGTAMGSERSVHRDNIWAIAYTPDGGTIISASEDKTVRLSRSDQQEPEILSGHSGGVACLAVSSDGTLLASGSHDHTVRLWHLEPGARESRVLRGHTDEVHAVSFSPDGSLVASASLDGTVRLWEVEDRSPVLSGVEQATGYAECLLGPGGVVFIPAPSDEAGLQVWDHAAGEELGVLTLPGGSNLSSVDLSPDGGTLAAADTYCVYLWDAVTFEESARLRSTGLPFYAVRFDPTGERVATARHGQVDLWDARTGQYRARLPMSPRWWVQGLAFSPDGALLAALSYAKDIKVFDTVTLDEVWGVEEKGESFDRRRVVPSSVAFSRDGRELAAVASDRHAVRRWTVGAWEEPLDSLFGHHGSVLSIDYSPDGTRIVTSGRDGIVMFWERKSGESIVGLGGHDRPASFASVRTAERSFAAIVTACASWGLLHFARDSIDRPTHER